jgi:hypothetical protein
MKNITRKTKTMDGKRDRGNENIKRERKKSKTMTRNEEDKGREG